MVTFLKKLNVLVVILTVLSFGSPYVSPAYASIFMFLGIGFPYLVLSNLFFAALWFTFRNRFALLSAVVLLCCIPLMLRTVAFNSPQKSEGTLKIMEYNVVGFSVPIYSQKVEGQKRMNAFLVKENPDIIAFLEFGFKATVYEGDRYNFTFQQKYPFKFHGDSTAITLYSKFPILRGFILPINNNLANGCIVADLNINGKIIRCYALHLQSNQVSSTADDLMSKSVMENSKSVRESLQILRRFRKYGIKRALEAEDIAAHIAQSPYPVIVCGDFNDTPLSYTYQTLRKNLKDTFLEGGRGFGISYNGSIPNLKIDNIFADKHFKTLNSKVLNVDFSDHYPMISELKIK